MRQWEKRLAERSYFW